MGNTVKCKILDPLLKKRWGEFINFDITRARRLKQNGLIEILDDCGDCTKKAVVEHKSRISRAENYSYLLRDGFSKKKLKIAWVQDYSKNGGAELSNKHIVSIGENCGFDIVGITPSNFHKRLLYEADIIVINNFFEFPQDKMQIIFDAIYEKRIPFIKYDHDHREMRRAQIARQLFSQSVLNVFISPEHQRRTAGLLGDHILKHSIALPLSINTKLYNELDGFVRDKNKICIPTIRKCNSNIKKYIEENNGKKYVIVGNSNIVFEGSPKIEHEQSIEADKMPELYSQCGYMLHLPDSFWAGERIFFEAILCGCKPIVNDNVGHNSWNYNNTELRAVLEKAPYVFWREVEKCLKI